MGNTSRLIGLGGLSEDYGILSKLNPLKPLILLTLALLG
ncbi:hypothetical protein HMPREF1229_0110 [Streptococcus pyogenes GA40634]|nr:hypothetical protein HMPREF1229_0110 [Streptococcus pyogenes GA40634]